jgi:MATE family multidrug resistance protein
MQLFLDVLVFHLFAQLVGRLGKAAMGATTLAFRLNMIAFLPMLGLGQAISVLVGQRLGANRPDLAERVAYTGLRWGLGYMTLVAAMYLAIPGPLVSIFEGESEKELFAAAAALVPSLLTCVAIYSVADAFTLTFAFALRGAGDTFFVSLLTFTLGWPFLVVPTVVIVHLEASLYWAWGFATAYIIAMAVCFYFRFRCGKWKTMRVIEPHLAGLKAVRTLQQDPQNPPV